MKEDIEQIRLYICKAQHILGDGGKTLDIYDELDKARGVIRNIQEEHFKDEPPTKCPYYIPGELVNRIFHTGQDNREAIFGILNMLEEYVDPLNNCASVFAEDLINRSPKMHKRIKALKAQLLGD